MMEFLLFFAFVVYPVAMFFILKKEKEAAALVKPKEITFPLDNY